MTATDELRRLLDERGVEWHCVDMRTGEERSNITEWNVPNAGWVEATELGGHLTYSWHMGEKPTPAQAVEATLGRGTCRIEKRHMDWRCTGCGEIVGTDDPTSELFIDGNAIELWYYCPNCGRRIEVDA
jgi:DNA-directed RNA polymerase subunit RPC12/RpoP